MDVQAVNCTHQKPIKKSKMARNVAAMGMGSALGITAANGGLFGSVERLPYHAEEVVSKYNRLPKEIKEFTSLEKYTKNFLKNKKIAHIAESCAGVGGIMLGAIGAGYIVDKCIDAYKSHKADKAEEKAAQQAKAASEEV